MSNYPISIFKDLAYFIFKVTCVFPSISRRARIIWTIIRWIFYWSALLLWIIFWWGYFLFIVSLSFLFKIIISSNRFLMRIIIWIIQFIVIIFIFLIALIIIRSRRTISFINPSIFIVLLFIIFIFILIIFGSWAPFRPLLLIKIIKLTFFIYKI